MNQMAAEVEQQFQIVVEKENQAVLCLYLSLTTHPNRSPLFDGEPIEPSEIPIFLQ